MSSGARRRHAGLGPALTLAEVAVVLAAALAAGAGPGPAALGAMAAVLVARAADLHRPRLVLSVRADLPGLLVAASAATAVVAVAGHGWWVTAVLAAVGLVAAHALVYAATGLRRRTGHGRRVLVVGTGPTARALTATLLDEPERGLVPVGFVATSERTGPAAARGLPLPLVGPVTALPRAMTEARVDAVVVALAGPARAAETAAVEGLLASAADVYAVPWHLPPVRAHAHHPRELVGDLPVVRLHRRAARAATRAVKRAAEVLVSGVALAVLVPVVLLLAVPVRLETGGVLVADRAGVRFRTRRAHSVARPGTTFSVAISGRTGRVGRFVRWSRLETLPGVVRSLVDTARYAGGVLPQESAAATLPDQPQVDAGQLTR